MYNLTPTYTAWDKNMFSELWPGWDQKLKESGANKIINTIGT